MPSSEINADAGSPAVEHKSSGVAVRITILAAILLVGYLLGLLFPESFLWGVHLLAFIPLPIAVSVIALLGLSLIPFGSSAGKPTAWSAVERVLSAITAITPLRRSSMAVIGLIAIAGGIVFYTNRIVIDMYGDARSMLQTLSETRIGFSDIFGFHDYEPLTRYIHQTISIVTQTNLERVYPVVSAAGGVLFLVTYLWYARTARGPALWRLFALAGGLFCGANQLFFGYVEDYTLVYLCMTLFLILVWESFDGKKTMPWVFICFIVGIKLHLQMILFGPALVYLVCYRISENNRSFKKWVDPSHILAGVGISLLLFVYLYLYIFDAFSLPAGHSLNETARIFLPVVNVVESSRGYSIFSLSHLSDFVQEIFLAVAPASVIVIGATVSTPRAGWWSSPRTIFYALAVFYFLLFNFTINTMLTPMRDWDMLALITPSVLFLGNALALGLFDRFQKCDLSRRIVTISFAFGILPIIFFYINSHHDAAGRRLRSLGIWGYKSYYSGSGYILNAGCQFIQEKPGELAERERIVRLLEPEPATPDMEMSMFLYKNGIAAVSNKDYRLAEEYYKKSLGHDPNAAFAIKALAVDYLLQWKFDESAELIERFNKNLNASAVSDFQSLLIAQYAHRCAYLVRRQAGRDEIQSVLNEVDQKISLK